MNKSLSKPQLKALKLAVKIKKSPSGLSIGSGISNIEIIQQRPK